MLCSAKNNAHVASDVTSERCHDNSEALGAATHGLIGYREKELPATKGGMRRFYEQQQFI